MWDPHTKDKTHDVEMVQRRATWWTLSDYARTTSVASLQSQLNWQTLEEGRSVARLCLFYKIVNGLVAVFLPDYMQTTHPISRYCHSMTFRQIHTGKDYYKYSFFCHWPLSSGMQSQPMLQLLQVLRSSRQQLDNCSISNPRQYTAYFNMILIVLDPPLHQFLVLSSLMVLLIYPRKLFLFLPHFDLDFNLSSSSHYNSFIFYSFS